MMQTLELKDPLMIVPKEEGKYKYVVQHHYRPGKKEEVVGETELSSVHDDIRWTIDNILAGMTLASQVAGKVPDVRTYRDALEADKHPEYFKIDWKKGEFKKHITKAGHEIRRGIYASRKGSEPPEWISYRGVVEEGSVGATLHGPGIFTIVDKGEIEFGSFKAYFKEMWLDGNYKGRLVFRLLPKGEYKRVGAEEFYWSCISPLDQMPYCLSSRAENKAWIPDYNYSAIPRAGRKVIPKEYQFWKYKEKSKRIEVRNALRKNKELMKKIEDAINKKYLKKELRQESLSIKSDEDIQPEIDNLVEWGLKQFMRNEDEWIKEDINFIRHKKKDIGITLLPRILYYFEKKEKTQKDVAKIWLQCQVYVGEIKGISEQNIELIIKKIKNLIENLNLKPFLDEDAKSGFLRKEEISDAIYLSFFIHPNYPKGYWENHTLSNILNTKAEFTLQHHYFMRSKKVDGKWVKVKVIRKGPGFEHFDLRLLKPDKTIWHLVLERNPLKEESISGITKPCKDLKSMDVGKDKVGVFDKPGPWNPHTKGNLVAYVDALGWGKAIILEDKEMFKKVQFIGKGLKGLWAFSREDPKSDIWVMEKSELPKPKT